MTILYAARRPTFAVLAADQLWTGVEWSGEERHTLSGLHTKLRVHPQRALAFGTAGVSVLGRLQTIDIVQESFAGDNHISLTQVGLLLQIILGERLVKQTQQEPEDVRGEPRVDVVMAEFVDGEVQLLAVCVSEGKSGQLRHGLVAPTPGLVASSFYSRGRFADDEGKFGSDGLTPAELVDHARQAVQEGIDEEERLFGDERQAGGDIDVVLVDADGARFA
jgi:hypothetical protein